MGSDTEMHEASAADLHHDKYIEDLKADGHRDEEVTGNHRFGMIADKVHPLLDGTTRRRPSFGFSSKYFWTVRVTLEFQASRGAPAAMRAWPKLGLSRARARMS